MSELTKLLLVIVLVVSVPFALIGYNLYTNAENRKLYAECLRTTERMAEANPNSISHLFCNL